MRHIILKLKSEKYFSYIYISIFLLSFHYASVVYINSNFISNFVSEKFIGLIYAIGALINIFIFLNIPKILTKIGNRKTMLGFLVFEMLALLSLAFFKNFYIILPVFLAHISISSILLFNLDIFLETQIKVETNTGGIRGIFMTMSNLAFIVAPITIGFILISNKYWKVYTFAALFLIPIIYIISKQFKTFKDDHYPKLEIKNTVKKFFHNKNITKIYIASFILQAFYAWMVIYMPLYLHIYMGFSWPQIGEMFAIILLPFIIFQIPGGKLADTLWGEKEMLIGGFSIMAITVFIIPFLTTPNIFWWTILLFLTRVGASIVEIMIDTYFFKHVKGRDSNIISLYRTASAIAYIIAPIIVSISLFFINLKFTYFVLTVIILYGIKLIIGIKDTLSLKELETAKNT